MYIYIYTIYIYIPCMDPMGKEWMGGFETIFEVDFSG